MRYHFADCMLDERRAILFRAGQRIRVSHHVFALLHYLVQHHDQVVPPAELCRHIWGKRPVSTATVERCLRLARISIGDTGHAQRILQTQRGFGYQCIAQVWREAVCPCPVCQQDTPEQGTFCVACGTQLQHPCPHCQQLLPLAARFCIRCGQPCVVSGPHPLVIPLPPQTDRRDVTVLCCTLLPINQTVVLDPEDRYSLLQQFWTSAGKVVSHHKGHLQAALDTRLYLLFDRQLPVADDAPRAVQAALALREWVQQQPVPWHAWPQSPVTVRMGLHTGRIMVHSQQNGRRDQGTILGDVVSMATRLQEHAAPGAILCSNATACLVRRTVGLDAMEPLPGQLVGEPIYAVRA